MEFKKLQVIRTTVLASILAVFMDKGGNCCEIVDAPTLTTHPQSIISFILVFGIVFTGIWFVSYDFRIKNEKNL